MRDLGRLQGLVEDLSRLEEGWTMYGDERWHYR